MTAQVVFTMTHRVIAVTYEHLFVALAVLQLHKHIKRAAMDLGLACYPMGGSIDGRLGEHILLAPPFIIDDAQIDELADTLAKAIDRALERVR